MRARRCLVATLHLTVLLLLSLCVTPATASDFARVRRTVAVATLHTVLPLRFDSAKQQQGPARRTKGPRFTAMARAGFECSEAAVFHALTLWRL